MAASTDIKHQIMDKIEALSSVQTVYGYERVNPTGWPAVMVKASDLEGEFSSNTENSRVYSYSVMIIFPIGDDFEVPKNKERLEYAEEVVATVVDDIINAIDTDYELEDSPVLFVNAADGIWGEYEYEGGVAKAFQMTLKVYTEKNIS
jgi:hypothetical protein